jgi:hypothetical protein
MDTKRWAMLGSDSFLLAVINTICVAGAAMAMFRLKEVAPPGKRVVFWKEDLRAAREAAKQQEAQHDTQQIERFVTTRISLGNSDMLVL